MYPFVLKITGNTTHLPQRNWKTISTDGYRATSLCYPWCYGYNSLVLVLMSVLFFLIFTTLDFKSKVINWIAASVFAVYLVHENQWFFRDLWYAMIESQYNRYPPVSFFCILLSECFLLYVIAILLDKLRNSITRRFLPIADRLQKLADLATTKMKSIWPLNQ